MRVRTLITALAVAFVVPAHPAKAAVGDRLFNVYVFPGARDDGGGSETGVATAVHCHSFSDVAETLRWTALDFGAAKKGDISLTINSSETRTMATHHSFIYAEDASMANALGNGPTLHQGTIYVFATTASVVCTANIINAASPTPQGIDLHGIRSNPYPTTLE